MKKNLLILLIILLYGAALTAQSNRRVIEKPKKYINPIDGVGMPSKQDEKSDFPWFVYSDRANNTVYSFQSDNSTNDYKPGFGEMLGVLDISDDGARLLVAREIDIEGRQLSDSASPLGWVDSDKLALWNKSIVDSVFHIDKKAMILFTIDRARQQLSSDGNFTTDVPVYKSPGSSSDTLPPHQGIFQFYPIFKKEGNFYLLGEKFDLDRSADFSGLKGWVDSVNISEWSHRIAWEKNWEPPSVRERMENLDSVGIMVLSTRTEAESYATTNRKRPFSDFTQYEATYLEMKFDAGRKPGATGRFPILDVEKIHQDENIFNQPIKVGVIGEIMDLEGKEIDFADISRAARNIKNLRKVNLLFVIDATESMEPYRESVIRGVRNALRQINIVYEEERTALEDRNDFLFGCVLYRDFHMNLITQTFGTSLGNDTTAFFRWLNDNMVPPQQHGINTRRAAFTGVDDLEEAMFYGINMAIEDYRPPDNESNYMIIIGDCGDHQGSKIGAKNEYDRKALSINNDSISLYVNMDSLVKKLDTLNMNVLAFQVHHKSAPAYDLFQEQIRSILTKLGQTELIPNRNNTNLLELNPENTGFVGKILPCERGRAINENQMSELISGSIIQINEDVNAIIKVALDRLQGRANEADIDLWSTAKVIKFFIDNDISEEQAINMTKSGLNQEYEVGYTVFKPNNYEHPYFQIVVLFSRSELEKVVNAFRDLSATKAYPVEEQRGTLKDVLLEWFPIYFSGVPQNILKDLPVGALLEKMTGLKFSERYKKITIATVVDDNVVSDILIQGFVTDIDKSLVKLEEIHIKVLNYPAYIEIPGDEKSLFVYIPADKFPTN
jgi:hypothetical protein